jgi:hypothetical protein
MKNFSELLATNLAVDIDLTVVPVAPGPVEVVINGKCVYHGVMQRSTKFHYPVPVLEPIEITVFHSGATVTSLCFDGWESRPQHGSDAMGVWRFTSDSIPFYQWKHHATGQGWLLKPTSEVVGN